MTQNQALRLVQRLSPERREWLLDQVELHKATAAFLGKRYSRQLCGAVEKKLKGV